MSGSSRFATIGLASVLMSFGMHGISNAVGGGTGTSCGTPDCSGYTSWTRQCCIEAAERCNIYNRRPCTTYGYYDYSFSSGSIGTCPDPDVGVTVHCLAP